MQCGAFDTVLAKQTVHRARAFASIETALERSRAASRDRERGQTNMFGLFDAGSGGKGSSSQGDYAMCDAWDRREALVRERQSLGFYVSGHPLERYLRGGNALAKLECVPLSELSGMKDWAVVKVVGMVEGYREKILRDGGGKIAFFELEDLSGRVNVKLRSSAIDTYAHVITSGEPIVVSGKVSFPRKDDDAPDDDDAPREATLFFNEAVPLSDVVRKDTRLVQIRVKEGRAGERELTRMADVLSGSPGDTPVSVILQLHDGAEAVLACGKRFRVEVGDTVLSGLERIFGEQVAELR